MKKIFVLIMSLVFITQTGFAATTQTATQTGSAVVWTTTNGLNRVNTIGKKILSANKLPTQIKFTVVETDDINAFANGNNEICVYTGLLNYVENDAELAAVIGHEIGHILNNHVAKQSIIGSITSGIISKANVDYRVKTGATIANNLSMLKMSRTEEYEADITSADLINNAGYNPLAMVSVIYKISGNYVDFIQSHPSGDKRTMYTYDYITYTYPAKAKAGFSTDSYKSFMNYAQPIVDERNANKSKLAAFNKKQAKLKSERLAKAKKYQQSGQSGWQTSYQFLQALAQVQQQAK